MIAEQIISLIEKAKSMDDLPSSYSYKYLLAIIHPDRFPVLAHKLRAEQAAKKLAQLRGSNGSNSRVSIGGWDVTAPLCKGDVADLYLVSGKVSEQTAATLALEFDVQISNANAQLFNAQHAVDLERVAAATQNPLYPIGSKLYRWKDTSGRFEQNRRMVLLGIVGVVEVFGPYSLRPANQACGIPDFGELVVRPLKKDGKPGSKVERLDRWAGKYWLPEGVPFDPERIKL